jgi:hypothetical protein
MQSDFRRLRTTQKGKQMKTETTKSGRRVFVVDINKKCDEKTAKSYIKKLCDKYRNKQKENK